MARLFQSLVLVVSLISVTPSYASDDGVINLDRSTRDLSRFTQTVIEQLASSIIQESSTQLQEDVEFLFSYPLIEKIVKYPAGHPLRQTYLREARKVFLYTGYSVKAAQAFFMANPQSALFHPGFSNEEVAPTIVGMGNVLFREARNGYCGTRSEAILGWYGAGYEILGRFTSNPADAVARQNFVNFVNELVSASNQSVTWEQSGEAMNYYRPILGGRHRMEIPNSLHLRLNILEFFRHRYTDEWFSKQQAAAIDQGLLALLSVSGDARFSRLVVEVLRQGPGYQGPTSLELTYDKGDVRLFMEEWKVVAERAAKFTRENWKAQSVGFWASMANPEWNQWLKAKVNEKSPFHLPQNRALLSDSYLWNRVRVGRVPARRLSVAKFSDPESEEWAQEQIRSQGHFESAGY